jgi:hypothetical protein
MTDAVPQPSSGLAPQPSSGLAPQPSITSQKKFICENAGVLNRATALNILHIVMMEIGQHYEAPDGSKQVVLTEKTINGEPEVLVNLDTISKINDEVITHIYNIVVARRATLSQPAGKN